MNPVVPLSMHPMNNDMKISLAQGLANPNYRLQDEAFMSRNCFVATQGPKRAQLKSYNRVKRPNNNLINQMKNSTFSTINHEGETSKREKKVHYPRAHNINIDPITPSPLENDYARDRMIKESNI
mmetsp:Transcript_31084/g.27488  ORF Transcript_31084/g.27488 Transcript_31084/m.27488 type:complete len:125 (-) Transcript_31084:632-1006(-)